MFKGPLIFVSVFLGALWRKIDELEAIPEPFRIKGRLTVVQAFRVARACARI